LKEPKTVQMRFSLSDVRTQTVMNFEPSASYRLNAVVHPSSSQTYYANYGRLDLISGSVQGSHPDSGSMISTDYFDLFDENPVSLQLKYGGGGVKLDVRKIENEIVSFTSSLTETAPSMSADWGSLSDLYIGHPAPSASVGYISASLDEFRLWGEQINDGKFVEFAENPGMFAGNTYTSSLQELFVRLSFNLPTDVSSSGYVVNASPYVSKSIGLDLTNISSSKFVAGTSPLYQHQRGIRTTMENSYKVGARTPTTDMIRIAPEPPLSGALSMTSPLVPISKKFASSSVGSTQVDMSISPVDAVDRDIIRSFGNFNLGEFIGRPSDRDSDTYPLLDDLERTFIRDLAPTIDYNSFVRFFDKFLHLFTEVVKEYIPARANVTDGIVIRAPIVNRSKMSEFGRYGPFSSMRNRGIAIDGEVTQRTKDMITSIDKDVIKSFDVPIAVTGSFNTEVQADYSSLDASLSLNQFTAVAQTGSKLLNASVVYGYDLNQTGSNFDVDLVRPKKEQGVHPLFAGNPTASLASTTTASVSPVQNGALSFRPVDDFTTSNIESYSYFAQANGFAYMDDIKYVPVTQSWMMTQPNVVGDWSSGTSYVLGDVVTQPVGTKDNRTESSTSGSELSETGNQFVFINRGYPQNTKVKSIHPPQLDTVNWTLLKYRGQSYQRLVRMAYVGGNTENVSVLKNIVIPGHKVSGTGIPAGATILTVTPSTSSSLFELSANATDTNTVAELTLTDEHDNSFVIIASIANTDATVTHTARYDSVAQEYGTGTRKHFRFYREDSIGARRRTYEGTVNTETTTVDFGPPFETFDINVNVIQVGSPTPRD